MYDHVVVDVKVLEDLINQLSMLKCRRCGSQLLIRFEQYRDDNANYISMYFKCIKCDTKYVLNGYTFVEVY